MENTGNYLVSRPAAQASACQVIAVVGPTATGKSQLAEFLAQQLNGEIISADSMQVYRGMDIGTAKVPLSERSTTYHCIDLVSPAQEFNIFAYQQEARKAIADILARAQQPILCGGSGLYVRAALDDFVLSDPQPPANQAGLQADGSAAQHERAARRESLTKEANELGPQAFHAKLAALDPRSAGLIHPNNVRRLVRAFEWLDDGSSYAEQTQGFRAYKCFYPTLYIGLELPRAELYERINARVEQMLEAGLLAEVETLLDSGLELPQTAAQAIGYKELREVLLGTQSLEAAVEQIKQATRRYAKRQLTWFKRDERIHWLDARLSLDSLAAAIGRL